ncbi:MAG: hypothetical protein K6B67_05530 [Lachnospiraceae bacterium]|nr:hypothetical protein [Lachnospiraceae bacterium]
MNKEAKCLFLTQNFISKKGVIEMLCISRQYLTKLEKQGDLCPVEGFSPTLYLKEDVYNYLLKYLDRPAANKDREERYKEVALQLAHELEANGEEI